MMRRIIRIGFSVVGGLLGCRLALYGLAAVGGIDFHQNTVLSVLYCTLPLLSLPLILFAFAVRRLLPLQVLLALAYVTVYSALNWRTCAELGYCGSVAATVLLTLRTHSVLAYFGAAICSLAAFVVDDRTARFARIRN